MKARNLVVPAHLFTGYLKGPIVTGLKESVLGIAGLVFRLKQVYKLEETQGGAYELSIAINNFQMLDTTTLSSPPLVVNIESTIIAREVSDSLYAKLNNLTLSNGTINQGLSMTSFTPAAPGQPSNRQAALFPGETEEQFNARMAQAATGSFNSPSKILQDDESSEEETDDET